MKTIGIVGWATGENSFGITKPYMNFASSFGRVEIISPTTEIRDDYDLVIIPGGPDVDTLRYSQVPQMYTSKPCHYREFFDKIFLPNLIENNIPLFGICRGFQSLYVTLGGSLIQDFPQEHNEKYNRQKTVHKVKFLGEYEKKYSSIMKIDKKGNKFHEVNSIHHQVADTDAKPEVIDIIGIHPMYKNPEYFKHKTKPIYAMQGHPEEYFDEVAVDMINELLNI